MLQVLQRGARRWAEWQAVNTNRRIFGAFTTIALVTSLVKIVSVVKELFVAYQFGTSSALDAFLIAYLLPSFAVAVLAGSVNVAFIPSYVELRERKGLEEAQIALASVLYAGILLLTGVSVLAAVSISWLLPILGSGFGDETLATTRSLFFVVLPTLLLAGLATIWTAVLNAEDRYGVPALIPIMTPVVIITVLVVSVDSWGIYALAVGTVLGVMAEASLLGMAVWRLGISVKPNWSGLSRPVRQIWQQYVPMVVGAALMSGTLLVDRAMAAMLEPGSVAALNYGSKVLALVIGVASVALGSAALPYFSKIVAYRDWTNVKETLRSYGGAIIAITLPVTLVLMYFSEPLVQLLFQRGEFTADDTRMVARVQLFYFPQLPFYILSIFLTRAISSLKGNAVLMRIAVINLGLNVLLNYLFMLWIGLPGIALSTSVVYALSTFFIAVALWKMLRQVSK